MENKETSPIVYSPRLIFSNKENGMKFICGYIAENKDSPAYFFNVIYSQFLAGSNISIHMLDVVDKVYEKDIATANSNIIGEMLHSKNEDEFVEKQVVLYSKAWNEKSNKFEESGKNILKYSMYADLIVDWLNRIHS